jgi:hypothetical protein
MQGRGCLSVSCTIPHCAFSGRLVVPDFFADWTIVSFVVFGLLSGVTSEMGGVLKWFYTNTHTRTHTCIAFLHDRAGILIKFR